MDKLEFIEKTYDVFSKYKKPAQCTVHTDLEDAEFNSTLLSVTRRNLTIEQVGNIGWGPIPSMNPEALAYFMPHLIELAITNAMDRDGDPFFCLFINAFHKFTNDERFRLFGPAQKFAMVETFKYLCKNYQTQLKLECWYNEANRLLLNGATLNKADAPDRYNLRGLS
jgi:hypothetical protein